MFINFMCETQVALANAEYICYSSPQNAQVRSLLPPELAESDNVPFGHYLALCETLVLPTDVNDAMSRRGATIPRLQRQRLGVPRDAGRHAGPFGLWLLAQRPPAGAKASIKHLLQGCMPCKKLRPGHAGGGAFFLRQSQTFQIEGRGIFLPGAAFFLHIAVRQAKAHGLVHHGAVFVGGNAARKRLVLRRAVKRGVYWLKFCGPSPARKRSTASESRRAPGRGKVAHNDAALQKARPRRTRRPSLRQHPAQSGRGHGKIIRRGGIFARKRAGNVLHIRQPYIHIRRQGRTVCSVCSYPPVLYTTGRRRPCARALSSAAVTHGA